MIKLATKLAILVLIAVGVYFYFNRDQVDYHPTVDVEEVAYEDIAGGNEELLEEEPAEEDGEEGELEEAVEEEQEELPVADQTVDVEETSADEVEEGEELPAQFNLAVPFTSQAPHGDWELPYQEACEEASAYMVAEYFKGTPSGKIDPDVADADLLEVVEFQEDFFGYFEDTTVAETIQFIDFFYGLAATAVEDPTVDQIKAEIAAGRPVIIPAAGRELGNPNFTGLGPLYHMLVIKGYADDKFITNDPGTRNGASYVYDIDVIMDAIGDWNGGDPANGDKIVIFMN